MADLSDHKAQLRAYFDGIGFDRWVAIYGQAELSPIRRTIRDGHAMMMAQAEAWLLDRMPLMPAAAQALDAGCGTGLFSVALARRGFAVTAVDIAPQMVNAAAQQARRAGVHERVRCLAGDLESVSGCYDAVTCLDVLVHYPAPSFTRMCARLAQLSRGALLLTYAPYEPVLAALHWLGGRFPRGHRRTDIQMVSDQLVQQTLEAAGMQVCRSARISKGFYHVTLLEAFRAE